MDTSPFSAGYGALSLRSTGTLGTVLAGITARRHTAAHVLRFPVHEPVVVRAPNGHAATVDHVHWAAHADAVLAPRPTAPRTAVRLLRRSCERLTLPRVILDDASIMLGRLVAAGVEGTHDRVRVDLDTDSGVIRMRVTAAPIAPAEVGSVMSMARGERSAHAHLSPSECWICATETATELTAVIRAQSADG